MSGRALPWLIVSQLVVTLSLLGFAYAVADGGIQNLVIGATIAHWLNESGKLGRQVSDERLAKIIGNTDGAAVLRTGTPSHPGG